MENHSFDNYLGLLGRGDGFTLDATGKPTAANTDGHGNLVHAFHMPTPCQLEGHPSQDWNASHRAWDNGRNDGFVRASGPVAGPFDRWYARTPSPWRSREASLRVDTARPEWPWSQASETTIPSRLSRW